ncbi:MAG: hypothetical protein R3C62_17825 [Chloroflexota bacterium]
MIKRHLPLLLLTLLVLLALPPQLRAQSGNRAALVLDFGNGNVVTSCVAFAEPEITGRDLLERAGMSLAVAAFGGQTAVCGINSIGCPASDCWCQCQGSDCTRWSYWHGAASGWEYALAGDELFAVGNGAVEGWRWGLGTQSSAEPPPFYRFDQVCAVEPTPTPIPLQPSPTARGQAATAVPTATATVTPTPSPSATATLLPQTTGEPTATFTPLPTATFGITRTPTPEPGLGQDDDVFTPPPTAVLSALTQVPPTTIFDALLDTTRPPTAEPPIVTFAALPTLAVTPVVQPEVAVAAVVPTTAPPTTAVIARIGANAETAVDGTITSPATPAAAPTPATNWLSYAAFALITLALAALWLRGRKEKG